MKLFLLSLSICLCVHNGIGQCNFSSVPVNGDSCNLGPVDLQNGESVDKCGLICVCDTDHLHCCLGSSCAIVDHTTTSVSVAESGHVTSQSRMRRSLFFSWIIKRIQRLNNYPRNLVRNIRESTYMEEETTSTTMNVLGCGNPTPHI